MAKLTIDITATLTAFSNYADQLGYQAVVPDQADPTITVPNPETKQAFLARNIKHIVATALAARSVEAVRTVKNDEFQAQKTTLEDKIKNAMTVTIA